MLNTGGFSGFHLVRRGFQLTTSRNRRHFVRGGAPVFSFWRCSFGTGAPIVVSEPLLLLLPVVVPANGCGGPASDKAGGAAVVVIELAYGQRLLN